MSCCSQLFRWDSYLPEWLNTNIWKIYFFPLFYCMPSPVSVSIQSGAKSFYGKIMMVSSNGNIFCINGPSLLVISGFLSQRPVTQSFDVFFDLRLNKWLSKQSRCQWFEMPLHSLQCHCSRCIKNSNKNVVHGQTERQPVAGPHSHGAFWRKLAIS